MIHDAATADDFVRCAAINNAVNPCGPVTPEQLSRREGERRFLLHDGGGYAFVTPSSVPHSAYAMVRVAPEARRRGIGSELLAASAEAARTLGADSLWGRVSPDDGDSLDFASRRGFVEVGREVDLVRALEPGEGEIPPGIVELREEHLAGAYAVALESMPDMPLARRAEAGSFDQWVEQNLSGPVAFAALDGEQVVGFAALSYVPAAPGRLEHGFTGVLRRHRGRGIATALQRAEIAWAAGHGYRELVTGTQELNAALRAVKAKLGYVERSASILVRGPLEEGPSA
jgi:GNAT superfamily N-acetyltransferase